MFLSLCYLVLRCVLQLLALRVRSNDFKDLEIVVLRHELAILAPPARTLAILHRDAGDAPSLASALGGEAVDVSASSRPSPDPS